MQDKAEQGRARQDGKAKDHDIDVDGLWTPNIGWADEGTRGRGDEAAWRRGAAVNNPNDGADEPRSAYFTKQLVLGSIMIQYRIPRLIQPAGRSSASAPAERKEGDRKSCWTPQQPPATSSRTEGVGACRDDSQPSRAAAAPSHQLLIERRILWFRPEMPASWIKPSRRGVADHPGPGTPATRGDAVAVRGNRIMLTPARTAPSQDDERTMNHPNPGEDAEKPGSKAETWHCIADGKIP
ncbi:hypothetical protein JHW43_002379 [Diplocarpon mali]|nr:hypothetical protein JHW43_002379 [Diplocarpon mali]